jgi:transglutaminase-like putative cysteine protease
VVEERVAGGETGLFLVGDDGRVLEQRLGASVVVRAEPEAVARRLDAIDLFGLTRVPLPKALPHEVPMVVTLRLRGLPRAFRLEDARQRYQDLPGGETQLTITAAPAPPLSARDEPCAAAAVDEWLKPSRSWIGEIDSDAPALRALAKEVAGDTPGAYAAAVRLSGFVHDRLRKALGQSQNRATDVLAAGAGDCTEHALLLTALARAAGVRARPVFGLVEAVLGDGVNALYWHAWVEVRVGGEWLALDPTMGQEVADATHLLLGRDSAADVLALLGGLRVVSAAAAAPVR